ncbi:Protein kinase [Gracilaria domingensis]|nr:Protein kinase [Gracilaria domingensis]
MAGKLGAYLRYTETTAPRAEVEGWLVKEGRKLRKPTPRYLKLQGSQLSNQKSPSEPPTWTVSVVDCAVGPGTRSKELVVRFPNRTMSFFAESVQDFEKWMISLKRASASDISIDNFYDIGEVIGVGVNGDVLKGWDRVTNEVVAIKTIPYEGDMDKGNDPDAECEIEIIKSLDHPHLVKTYDVFRSKAEKRFSLLWNMFQEGSFSPELSMKLEILSRKEMGSGFRTENVLCIDEDFQLPLRIKLADFGLSKKLTGKDACLSSLVGTGCRHVGMRSSLSMSPEFPKELWGFFTDGVKDLIGKLLEKDPSKRLTVDQALQHPWVTDKNVPNAEPAQAKDTNDEEADVPKSIFRRRRKRPEDILAKMRSDYEQRSSSMSQMTS